jgi:hypothetical protein
MIDPAGRLHNPALTDGIVSGGSKTQAARSQSFATELSEKLAVTAKSTAAASDLPASLSASQLSAMWRDPGRTGAPTSAPSSEPSGLDGLVINYPNGTSGLTTATAETSAQPMSFDESYWASQPAAVQQLQNIQNPTERAQLGTKLAQEGYSIDVPIMVWGWDPQTTTAAREAMGYTWVPSAQQAPVEVAPGLTYAGVSYNSSQPPPGSITV